VADAPRLGALVLAAGLSTRFAAGDKLLHPYAGRPLLDWALETVQQVPLAWHAMVTGPGDPAKAALARARRFALAINPDPAAGMGDSIAAGMRILDIELDGLFIVLGDMPHVGAAVFTELASRFAQRGAGCIVAPAHRGQRGHPVLFGAAHFAALRALRGDHGARAVLTAAEDVLLLPVADSGVLRDVDTLADLPAAQPGSDPE
jgi:molybdenum cofactor cytidylyltransferase